VVENCAVFGLLWQNVAKAVSAISASPPSAFVDQPNGRAEWLPTAVQFDARPVIGESLLEGGSAGLEVFGWHVRRVHGGLLWSFDTPS
jgi:hypothetical protein